VTQDFSEDIQKLSVWRSNKPRKPKTRFARYLHARGKQLQAAHIPSEEWFKSMLDQTWLGRKYLAFNKPFGRYIPDVRSKRWKIIIEVDGSVHCLPEQIERDKMKDEYYRSQGYAIFRVRAYSNGSFWQTMRAMTIWRKEQKEKL